MLRNLKKLLTSQKEESAGLSQGIAQTEPAISSDDLKEIDTIHVLYRSIDEEDIERLQSHLTMETIHQDLGNGLPLMYAINTSKLQAMEAIINYSIKIGSPVDSETYLYQIAKLGINKSFSDSVLLKMVEMTCTEKEKLKFLFLTSTDKKNLSPFDYFILYNRKDLAKEFIIKYDIPEDILDTVQTNYIYKIKNIEKQITLIKMSGNYRGSKSGVEEFTDSIEPSISMFDTIRTELAEQFKPELVGDLSVNDSM